MFHTLKLNFRKHTPIAQEEYLKLTSIIATKSLLSKNLLAALITDEEIKRSDFGKYFERGMIMAAYQIEGGWNEDDKSESNWGYFTHHIHKVKITKTRQALTAR